MDNKKKSKKFILAIVAVLLIIGAAILGFVLWYNLPINKINRAFEEGDIKEVVRLFPELTKDEDIDSVSARLRDMAGNYYDDYLDGDMSYDDTMAFFKLVSRKVLKKDKQVTKLINNINEIEQSRTDFNEALILMKDEDYLGAISLFNQVSKLDKANYKKAAAKIEECKTAYCENAIEAADELIESGDYEGALEVVQEALEILPDDEALLGKLAEIMSQLDVDLAGKYTSTIDLGDLIAGELGLTGYNVYFPAVLVLELSDDKLKIYVDPDSIESALNALTANEESMEAVYSLADEYGINKKEADILIALTYGGSYAKFIMDNFGGEIQDALDDFTHEVKCHADSNYIYIGTTDKNDNNYLTYSDNGTSIKLESYKGSDSILSLLPYPSMWTLGDGVKGSF